MKKVVSIVILFLALVSSNVYSQTNLTWVVKDRLQDNTFKTKQDFHISVNGLNDETEANEYCNKIRSNPDVESCDNLGKDNQGAYSVNFKMKKPKEASYYLTWAQKLEVSYIEAKGEKKTPAEWLKGERK